MTPDQSHILDEAQKLHEVRWYCSNETLAAAIGDWIKELLDPLVEDGVARAKWLYDAVDDWGDLTKDEYEQRHLERLKAGAAAEIPDAMLHYAHTFYEAGKYEEAAVLYRKAADAGHAYAKWCHGLDLTSGTGVPQDMREGLRLIEEAAEQHFEGAIQFMANAYASGQYGFPRDEGRAAIWQRKLCSPDLIRF